VGAVGRLCSMLSRCCTVLLLLTVLTACGDEPARDADDPAPTPSATSGTTEATPSPTHDPASSPTSGATDRGTRIIASSSELGQMLFDATGQAIYLFDVETTSKPRCYDACAEAWPPVLTRGEPAAGPGVAGSMLGTTERSDGTLQVTYNDHPLYFYAHEGRREVKCHDVFLNGGNWYVVQPDGDPAPPG
jgi:predicted lipoprotein with Yx(FWY)xxD motif